MNKSSKCPFVLFYVVGILYYWLLCNLFSCMDKTIHVHYNKGKK